MVEVWDLYDKNRVLLNKTHVRGIPLAKGEYHLVTDIWLVNNKNQILITQRHPNKIHGLLWECTGGAALSGEDSKTSVLRELSEETGIIIKKEQLTLINTIRLNDRFVDTYITKQNISLNDLILQKEEVINARFISFDELYTMWENGLIVPRKRFKIYKKIIEEYINNFE